MKRLLLLLPLFVIVTACDQKPTTTESIKNKVNDALDRRPNEKLRDAAEDLRDRVKEAAKDLKAPNKDAK
jgi:hypothetical protein